MMAAEPNDLDPPARRVEVNDEDNAEGSQRVLHAVPDPLPEEEEILAGTADPAPDADERETLDDWETPDDGPATASASLAEPDTDLPAPNPPSSPTSRSRRVLQWLLTRLELVTQDRPSLAKVWRYGHYSEQLPPSGPARWASLAYLYGIALPVVTIAYGVAWVVERPSRFAIASAVLAAAAAWAPSRAVLTVLLSPLQLLLYLLTD